MGIQQPRTVSFVRTERWGKEHVRTGGTDHVPRTRQTCQCLHGDRLIISDTPPRECLILDTLEVGCGTSYPPLPGTGELQQLPSKSWAELDCPSQCFTLITASGIGMRSAVKEIPASHLNLAKLSWRSNLGELFAVRSFVF